MELNALTAISPVDGRYRHQVQHLDEYFSEFALIKYRVLVEVEYVRFLADKKFFSLSAAQKKALQEVCDNFSVDDALKIKDTEKITNHDVKAVEYFLKEKMAAMEHHVAGHGRGHPDCRDGHFDPDPQCHRPFDQRCPCHQVRGAGHPAG